MSNQILSIYSEFCGQLDRLKILYKTIKSSDNPIECAKQLQFVEKYYELKSIAKQYDTIMGNNRFYNKVNDPQVFIKMLE